MRGTSAFALLIALATTACSEETTTDEPLTPPMPPTLALVSPTSGSCVAIGTDVTARVPLELDVTGVVLRPPGACGVASPCGYLRVRADGRDNNVGAQTTVDVLLGKLSNPYHDGATHAGTGNPDVLDIDVTLVDATETTMLDADGKDLTISLGLAVKPTCD
ncbi:MAG: hypothetical protein FJ096_09950 [Deltaproteobacteria bacterium]|nr:hypothetical protein [Deltaproteobacteria bacterium]